MSRRRECVIDTMVLQKANATLTVAPREASAIRVRLAMLERIRRGDVIVLISVKLLAEYRRQIRAPRNDAIRAFFELLAGNAPRAAVRNWQSRWSGGMRADARGCGFPREDDHLLRTAIHSPGPSSIVTEERRQLNADDCIYRRFRVHIVSPASI